MASTQPFALYNPALLSSDALLGEFIARRSLLETLLDIVRQNVAGQAPQHVLLVGARGMGKTTTLWAIAHSVKRDPVLARTWQPVVFDEESRRVGDLADFWLEAIRQWEHATKDPNDRTKALLDQPGTDIADRARQVFLDTVSRSGRRALLLIDNLNDVLGSISDAEPLHRLRAFLMEESSVMLVGGATRYFPQITDVDQPFYDFFRIFPLKPLSLEEMKECLLSLARARGDSTVEKTVREREGTMRSLHLLTGGNPRLIKTFYRLLAEGLRGDVRTDLERLLDEFTPYFKSMVDALPMQQQRIFDAVALHWDPVDVATIAHATRLPSNQVSAQLRALVKSGYVAEPAGRPKRKAYLLSDRFSNIHYLMRHGRASRSRLDWFVAMLQLVFPDQAHAETFAKVARQAAECGPDGMRDARDLLHSALRRAESGESRRQLLEATFREGWNNDTLSSFSEWFDVAEAKQHLPECEILAFFERMPTDLRRKLDFKPRNARWWTKLARLLEEKSAWVLAEAACRKAIEIDPEYVLPRTFLGNLLGGHLNRPTEAEASYRKALELDPTDSYTWTVFGNLLSTERVDEAEAAYRKAVEVEPDYAYAWSALGRLLDDRLHRAAEAEAAYRKAIEADARYRYAWYLLAMLIVKQPARLIEAEGAFRKLVELDPSDGYSWSRLANILSKLQKPDARLCAIRGLSLAPSNEYIQNVFRKLCAGFAEDWRAVLPPLRKWCASNRDDTCTFEFMVDGFLELARLTDAASARSVLEVEIGTTDPFETLRDAFVACGDLSHLEGIAPERRVVAIELMKRISQSANSDKAADDSFASAR